MPDKTRIGSDTRPKAEKKKKAGRPRPNYPPNYLDACPGSRQLSRGGEGGVALFNTSSGPVAGSRASSDGMPKRAGQVSYRIATLDVAECIFAWSGFAVVLLAWQEEVEESPIAAPKG